MLFINRCRSCGHWLGLLSECGSCRDLAESNRAREKLVRECRHLPQYMLVFVDDDWASDRYGDKRWHCRGCGSRWYADDAPEALREAMASYVPPDIPCREPFFENAPVIEVRCPSDPYDYGW